MQVLGNERVCFAKRKTFAMMGFDEVAGFCKVEWKSAWEPALALTRSESAGSYSNSHSNAPVRMDY